MLIFPFSLFFLANARIFVMDHRKGGTMRIVHSRCIKEFAPLSASERTRPVPRPFSLNVTKSALIPSVRYTQNCLFLLFSTSGCKCLYSSRNDFDSASTFHEMRAVLCTRWRAFSIQFLVLASSLFLFFSCILYRRCFSLRFSIETDISFCNVALL